MDGITRVAALFGDPCTSSGTLPSVWLMALALVTDLDQHGCLTSLDQEGVHDETADLESCAFGDARSVSSFSLQVAGSSLVAFETL